MNLMDKFQKAVKHLQVNATRGGELALERQLGAAAEIVKDYGDINQGIAALSAENIQACMGHDVAVESIELEKVIGFLNDALSQASQRGYQVL